MMKRRRLSADAWAAMAEKFDGSGLSAEAFCQQERVSLAGLQRWCTKRGQPSTAASVRSPRPTASIEATPFVDLGALQAGATRVELRLDFGSGIVLQLCRG